MAAEARTLHSLEITPTPRPLAPPRVTSGKEHSAPTRAPGVRDRVFGERRPQAGSGSRSPRSPGSPPRAARGRQRGAEVG